MTRQTPLGRFLSEQLALRGLTAEQFAIKAGLSPAHAYQIVKGDRKNPRRDTLEKVAAGLGLTLAELEYQLKPPAGDDPVRLELERRLPEIQAALSGIPRQFWATVLQATLGRVPEQVGDYAALLPRLADAAVQPPLSAQPVPRISADPTPLNPRRDEGDERIGANYAPVRGLARRH